MTDFQSLLRVVNFFFLAGALSAVFVYAARQKNLAEKINKLRLAAHQFQLLFQTTTEGVFRCDRQGTFISINPAGARILGFDDETAMIQARLDARIVIGDKTLLKKLRDNLLAGDSLSNMIVPASDCKGMPLYLEISAHIQPDQDEVCFEGIFRDVTARVRMERELETHKTRLEELVAQRTEALEASNARLIEHQNLLQELSLRQFKLQENERRQIASELHDSTGQMLSALRIDLERLRRLNPEADRREFEQALGESVTITETLIETVHDMSLNLRPVILDDMGLSIAVEWLIDRFQERSGIRTFFINEMGSQQLEPDLESVAYRMVQEGLNNIEKYAQAREVTVHFTGNQGIEIIISDDGVGFDPASILFSDGIISHMGLLGMREQALSLRGSFDIKSAPGKGTRLTIYLPQKEDADD